MKTLKIAAMSLCLSVGAAGAVTFDFLENSADSSSKTFLIDGLDLTVTAGVSGDDNGSAVDFEARGLSQNETDGLGVWGRSDFDQIDGKRGNDVIVLTFDRMVSIEAIFFSKVDKYDYFAFGTVDDGVFNRVVDMVKVARTVDLTATYGSIFSKSFAIGALTDRTNFKLEGLSVLDQTQTFKPQVISFAIPTPVVPLPATGLFLMAGLGAIGLAARKKR